jgi:hypothetical protein
MDGLRGAGISRLLEHLAVGAIGAVVAVVFVIVGHGGGFCRGGRAALTRKRAVGRSGGTEGRKLSVKRVAGLRASRAAEEVDDEAGQGLRRWRWRWKLEDAVGSGGCEGGEQERKEEEEEISVVYNIVWWSLGFGVLLGKIG